MRKKRSNKLQLFTRFYHGRILPYLLGTAVVSALCAMPICAAASADIEGSASVPIRHRHTGSTAEKGGCYTLPVYHTHSGDSSGGGACYESAIYHIHGGDISSGGECYRTPVYHDHQGSEAAGGSCYAPVYHTHSGDEASGGACYQTPVYHVHAGEEVAGGSCYTPVYHVHDDGCYADRSCRMTLVNTLQTIRTFSEYCYHHKNTQHIEIEGLFHHNSCGSPDQKAVRSACGICGIYDFDHTYREPTCGRTETDIAGYALNCPKTPDTVDAYLLSCSKGTDTVDTWRLACTKDPSAPESYGLSCPKTAQTIDSYELSCPKTGDTVESWEINCGRQDNDYCGLLTLSNESRDWQKESVRLTATYKEDTEPETHFIFNGDKRYEWKTGHPDAVASEDGDSAQARENGMYTVSLLAVNPELNPKSLTVSLKVDNIDRTPPRIKEILVEDPDRLTAEKKVGIIAEDLQPDGSKGSGLAKEAYSFDGGRTWTASARKAISVNGVVEAVVRDNCGNLTTRQIVIDNIGVPDYGKEPDDGDGPDDGKEPDDGKDPDDGDGPDDGNEPDDSAEPGDSGGGGDEGGESGTSGGEDNTGGAPADNWVQTEVPAVPPEAPPTDSSKNTYGKKHEKKRKSEETIPTEVETDGAAEEKGEADLPALNIETQEETISPVLAAPEETMKLGRAEKVGFLHRPIVKAAFVTLGGAALAALIFWLLYLLCRGVRIYNDDGDGKFRYMGSCLITREKDCHSVRIPHSILEQSYTCSFRLRPGIVFVCLHAQEELVVRAGESSASARVEAGIPFRL